jgi:hypothetical protein
MSWNDEEFRHGGSALMKTKTKSFFIKNSTILFNQEINSNRECYERRCARARSIYTVCTGTTLTPLVEATVTVYGKIQVADHDDTLKRQIQLEIDIFSPRDRNEDMYFTFNPLASRS